jgi:hypothetical protein
MPTAAAVSRGNVLLFCDGGNHVNLRGLPGGACSLRGTRLHGWISLVTGKEQGISSENAREAKTCGDFPTLNQWLVEEFPARRNRELEPPEQGKNIAEPGTRLAQSAIISTPCSAENE